ncbi:MAG: ABC transporter ATP-binding protein [Candidatus Krumholzibacteriia bacterium]
MSSEVQRGDLGVRIRGLGKAYRIWHHHDDGDASAATALSRVRELLRRSAHEEFWALRDLDLDVRQGEVLGIVGRNGAGKSTLLKIISRITAPTTGRVDVWGRVGSLLEVGTGFHRELTGRENIYLNGGILGMKRREIDRRFDEIVEFAGTARFLDTPVKRYSSGMFVRLAFAVAAHLDTDVLIVDEVLSVGDAEFRKKCLSKMQDVATAGRTVLLVSHSAASIESLCTRCIWLDGGRLQASGDPVTVLGAYAGQVLASVPDVDLSAHPGRGPQLEPILQRMVLTDLDGQPDATVPVGGGLCVRLLVKPSYPLKRPTFGVAVSDQRGQRIFVAHTRFSPSTLAAIESPTWVECTLPDLRLVPGTYWLKLTVGLPRRDLDDIDNAATFEVLPRDVYGTGDLPDPNHGLMIQHSQWRLVTDGVVAG